MKYICTYKNGHLWHKANHIWADMCYFVAGINKLGASVKDDRAKDRQATKIQAILSDNLQH